MKLASKLISNDQIKEAIEQSAGLPGKAIAYIREKWGHQVTNSFYYMRLKRNPELAELAETLRHEYAWKIRGEVTKQAEAGDIESQKLYLKYFGRYCGAQAITQWAIGGVGKDDGPVKFIIDIPGVTILKGQD